MASLREFRMKVVMVTVIAAAQARPAKGNDQVVCNQVEEPGRLELSVEASRQHPTGLVDIFWANPDDYISGSMNVRGIAGELIRYDCGTGRVHKGWIKALKAAGDRCAAERYAVMWQIDHDAIKQGVESSWRPTRNLWKCEQRLARQAAKKAPPQKPMSKREECIADGNPPHVCDAAGLF